MNATDRKAALAHFERAGGDPERGDALWGCGNGHQHHTRAAANKCGKARLEWVSDAIAHNIKTAATIEPRLMTVVAGPTKGHPDAHRGDVIAA